MHHLETLISAIPPAVFAATGAMPPGHPPGEVASSPLLPFMYSSSLPSGVPPPSLHVFPLTNPSTHFMQSTGKMEEQRHGRKESFGSLLSQPPHMTPDQLAEEASRMSLTASYLYFDDEGYTRWQGETSGLPVLDLLVERHRTPAKDPQCHGDPSTSHLDWFPNRQPQRTDINPQTLWRLITSYIPPDLMDRCVITGWAPCKNLPSCSLVQCYLSTSYYILPFLHVPTFLAVRTTGTAVWV